MKTIGSFAVALISSAYALTLNTEIIYRPDVSPSLYKISRDEFPMAFKWPEDNFRCGAAMISPQHAITAAHCFEAGDFNEFEIELKGVRYTAKQRRENNCYDLPSGLPMAADVAIFVLDRPLEGNPVKGKDYVDIWKSSEKGPMTDKKFTLVGWGGSAPLGSNDFKYGEFHRAENIVNSIHDNMLIYTMDKQGEGGLPLEGIGYSGDSGSPALVWDDNTWKIAGVKSNGYCCYYGAENEYTRLGDIAYDWIMDNTRFSNGQPTEWVKIEDSVCENVWMDPSNDGTDWQNMFSKWDKSPKDNKIVMDEFQELYDHFACSNEGAEVFFNRIDTNNDNKLSVPEFKAAWSYFHGWACEQHQGGDGDQDDGGDQDQGGDDNYDDQCADKCNCNEDANECWEACFKCYDDQEGGDGEQDEGGDDENDEGGDEGNDEEQDDGGDEGDNEDDGGDDQYDDECADKCNCNENANECWEACFKCYDDQEGGEEGDNQGEEEADEGEKEDDGEQGGDDYYEDECADKCNCNEDANECWEACFKCYDDQEGGDQEEEGGDWDDQGDWDDYGDYDDYGWDY